MLIKSFVVPRSPYLFNGFRASTSHRSTPVAVVCTKNDPIAGRVADLFMLLLSYDGEAI